MVKPLRITLDDEGWSNVLPRDEVTHHVRGRAFSLDDDRPSGSLIRFGVPTYLWPQRLAFANQESAQDIGRLLPDGVVPFKGKRWVG